MSLSAGLKQNSCIRFVCNCRAKKMGAEKTNDLWLPMRSFPSPLPQFDVVFLTGLHDDMSMLFQSCYFFNYSVHLK